VKKIQGRKEGRSEIVGKGSEADRQERRVEKCQCDKKEKSRKREQVTKTMKGNSRR
jgi:hypothetical protein